jgi:hypothetical protein
MSTDVKAPPEHTAAALLSGIVGDLQNLVQQQVLLVREEVSVELRERTAAGAVIGLGAGTVLAGGMTLCLALSHLVHWVVSPVGMDPGRLPLWACFGLVAVLFLAFGGIVVRVGLAQFRCIKLRNATTV